MKVVIFFYKEFHKYFKRNAMYYSMNLTLCIYFKVVFNKTVSLHKEQIEPSLISVNITVQTTIKMNTGYLF